MTVVRADAALAAIDDLLEDWEDGPDAARWAPPWDEPVVRDDHPAQAEVPTWAAPVRETFQVQVAGRLLGPYPSREEAEAAYWRHCAAAVSEGLCARDRGTLLAGRPDRLGAPRPSMAVSEPRDVEVLHEGRWLPARLLRAYRKEDGTWRGVVTFSDGPGRNYYQARDQHELRPAQGA